MYPEKHFYLLFSQLNVRQTHALNPYEEWDQNLLMDDLPLNLMVMD